MRNFPENILLLIAFSLTGYVSNAQYTETINSNRPGNSQGAFSVGTGVLQFEAGGYYGNDDHVLRVSESSILGADYAVRYGLFFEALEINLIGSFQAETTTIPIGGVDQEFYRSNFRTNTLGVKYLIFDPHRSIEPTKPNLYSWRANQRFDWKILIPAVAVFAGANFTLNDNPYRFEGEPNFSPRFGLSTQHNWSGGWVLVTNIIADKLGTNFPTFSGIVTLTHAFTPKFAGFLEYQGLISDLYADDLARTGLAYLLGDNFQVDLSGLLNFKNTPSRWQIAAGVSYRFDMHQEDEFIDESQEGDFRRQRSRELQDQGN